MPQSNSVQSICQQLGLAHPKELLLHLPTRYEDATKVTPMSALQIGSTVLVEGTVISSEVLNKPRRMWILVLQDGSDSLDLRFFNFYVSWRNVFSLGKRIRAFGVIRVGYRGIEIVHPRCSLADKALPKTLTPVYGTVRGLSQARIRGAIQKLLSNFLWKETVSPEVVHKLNLPSLQESLLKLHAPPQGVSVSQLNARASPEWRRVIFDELLAQQLALRSARAKRLSQIAPCLADRRYEIMVLKRLPFALTKAQQNVWEQISSDLERSYPMNRLLQGDVGSGKTVIAALSAVRAVSSGWQAVLMAPTEILVQQHFRYLEGFVVPLGIRIAWLSGALNARQKREVKAKVAAGEVDLLIGTQAVIQDGVAFSCLGLIVIDEQHRFGVVQRLLLQSKVLPTDLENDAVSSDKKADLSKTNYLKSDSKVKSDSKATELIPHQLMLSATPIPRTLAMSDLADLDVSVIDEIPPGRAPVDTRVVLDSRRDEVIRRLQLAIKEGRQIYWVCPLVEESEALDLQNAQSTCTLLKEAISEARIELVHGRMTPLKKQQIMQEFKDGIVHVLVATTVVEVGIDVPNASLMVVEHADRFGLAQLHQLRGRIGRGSTASICILMYRGPLSVGARDRLNALKETQDGFEIARRDLAQRGPGEFLGSRQSGQDVLRFADRERDQDLMLVAQRIAQEMWDKKDPCIAHHLNRWFFGQEDFLRA